MRLAIEKLTLRVVTVVVACAAVASYSQQQKTTTRKASHASSALGKQIFASTCAGCHGLDGTGSQRAPNIVSNPQVQKLSEKELTEIISAGVPGTGMPPFGSLGAKSVAEVVGYLRSMQGTSGPTSLPGDPKRGEETFFGKAECSNCHMADGKGGFIGPDLTSYGQTHSAEKIKAAITDPAERDTNKPLVTAVTASGQSIQGIVRNEDNFSLQLQSLDGAFHFLSKSDLKSIDRAPGSIMPADYGSRLSPAQLNDLISYLLELGRNSTQAAPERPVEEE
jgi:putative heme-binding domain-containing protein